MGKRLEIKSGDRYNKLTIIKEVEPKQYGKKFNRRFLCKCDCGNETIVCLSRLRSNHTKSCGCIRGISTIHGHTKNKINTKTYNSYIGMKQRCYYVNHKFYENYGGRGIIMCDRWLESFNNFLEDMGERPEGCTIDRINSDGNYTPDNCRWSTTSEQSKNRRSWAKKNKNQLTLTLD